MSNSDKISIAALAVSILSLIFTWLVSRRTRQDLTEQFTAASTPELEFSVNGEAKDGKFDTLNVTVLNLHATVAARDVKFVAKLRRTHDQQTTETENECQIARLLPNQAESRSAFRLATQLSRISQDLMDDPTLGIVGTTAFLTIKYSFKPAVPTIPTIYGDRAFELTLRVYPHLDPAKLLLTVKRYDS